MKSFANNNCDHHMKSLRQATRLPRNLQLAMSSPAHWNVADQQLRTESGNTPNQGLLPWQGRGNLSLRFTNDELGDRIAVLKC
jgi:hypothetical protein